MRVYRDRENVEALQLGRIFQCCGIRNVYIDWLRELNEETIRFVFCFRKSSQKNERIKNPRGIHELAPEFERGNWRLKFFC